jgi:hypothetical protein
MPIVDRQVRVMRPKSTAEHLVIEAEAIDQQLTEVLLRAYGLRNAPRRYSSLLPEIIALWSVLARLARNQSRFMSETLQLIDGGHDHTFTIELTSSPRRVPPAGGV